MGVSEGEGVAGADQLDAERVDPPHVVWLSDPACRQAELVGNKCATLARLRGRGYDVPDGFCVTTVALVGGPAIYEKPVTAALRSLKSPWVARSSSTVEDSQLLAFPGLFSTLLDLPDRGSVLDSIEQIDVSTKSPSVVMYAKHHGVDIETVRMAVLVQSLVPAQVAGVAFSCDPVTGAPDVVIEANFGLGETVVDGSVTPDSLTVDNAGSVVGRTVGSKLQKVVTTTRGARVRRMETSVLERTGFALADAQAKAVAELTRRVEADLGTPVDVEWAFAGDRLHLLQARPVTTVTSHDDDSRR